MIRFCYQVCGTVSSFDDSDGGSVVKCSCGELIRLPNAPLAVQPSESVKPGSDTPRSDTDSESSGDRKHSGTTSRKWIWSFIVVGTLGLVLSIAGYGGRARELAYLRNNIDFVRRQREWAFEKEPGRRRDEILKDAAEIESFQKEFERRAQLYTELLIAGSSLTGVTGLFFVIFAALQAATKP